jgi:hypothetical protein
MDKGALLPDGALSPFSPGKSHRSRSRFSGDLYMKIEGLAGHPVFEDVETEKLFASFLRTLVGELRGKAVPGWTMKMTGQVPDLDPGVRAEMQFLPDPVLEARAVDGQPLRSPGLDRKIRGDFRGPPEPRDSRNKQDPDNPLPQPIAPPFDRHRFSYSVAVYPSIRLTARMLDESI